MPSIATHQVLCMDLPVQRSLRDMHVVAAEYMAHLSDAVSSTTLTHVAYLLLLMQIMSQVLTALIGDSHSFWSDARNRSLDTAQLLRAPPVDLLRQAGPAARAAAVGNAQALTPAAIFSALATVPQWTRREAVITRTFQFADFPAAMKFVHAVAELAEAAQHHPDVDIRWNRVMLALTTPDAGGLTDRDFALARASDALA